jgi:hypothetical protein
VTELLHRVVLRTVDQGREVMARNFLPWVGEQLRQDRELVIEARLLDDDVTDKQRAYLHGVVLAEIAQFARPGGVQHDMKTWKEYFRSEWLGFNVVTSVNPLTGRKVRRRVRVSTEDLGVRAMAEYIDRIIAFAATELGVQVSEPLPPELRPQRRRARAVEQGMVDKETGEIQEAVA